MSQHFWVTHYNNRPTTVFSGWDRRLGGFFLSVEINEAKFYEEETCLYSSSHDVELLGTFGYTTDLDYFKCVLTGLGIELPPSMVDCLVLDREVGMGNAITNWNDAGEKLSAWAEVAVTESSPSSNAPGGVIA